MVRRARRGEAAWGLKEAGVGSIVLGLCILLWAACSERIMLTISSTVRDVRNPRVESIAAVTLLPHDRGDDLYAQLCRTPIRIQDRSVIQEITQALRSARPWHANHPYAERICLLALEYEHRTRYCEVSWTKGQGVLFRICHGRSPFPGLGAYRNDALGPILLRAAQRYGTVPGSGSRLAPDRGTSGTDPSRREREP